MKMEVILEKGSRLVGIQASRVCIDCVSQPMGCTHATHLECLDRGLTAEYVSVSFYLFTCNYIFYTFFNRIRKGGCMKYFKDYLKRFGQQYELELIGLLAPLVPVAVIIIVIFLMSLIGITKWGLEGWLELVLSFAIIRTFTKEYKNR